MLRLLFEKKGNAVWISHLDLMRLFQRAFKRAGLPLTHTQGFNPRPSVSIALPLSVGTESCCELLDFELDGAEVSCDEIIDRLNQALIDGVFVRKVYTDGRKLKELAFLSCRIDMFYDATVPEHALDAIRELFDKEEILVSKKTKNGIQEQNIIPMIQHLAFEQADENLITANATVCCQNPSLNPMQIVAAVQRYSPEMKPNHAKYCRLELFDYQNTVFR